MKLRRAADRKTRPTERVLIVITILLAILALGGELRVTQLSPLSITASK